VGVGSSIDADKMCPGSYIGLAEGLGRDPACFGLRDHGSFLNKNLFCNFRIAPDIRESFVG